MRSANTIYDELRKLAVKMGVTQEALSKTHNIKDLLRAMTAYIDGPSTAGNIADGVKQYTDNYESPASGAQE